VIYANIDGFNPATHMEDPGQLDHKNLITGNGFRPASERSELDRWMLAELHATANTMVEALDSYDHYVAAKALSDLVDAVSNWFVRRSRDRFWASGKADASADGNPEKCDAYWTLYEVLTTTARLPHHLFHLSARHSGRILLLAPSEVKYQKAFTSLTTPQQMLNSPTQTSLAKWPLFVK
jgi:isoleucyl-tRNA synthetase